MPPIGWLRAVRALCDELDVLMIADEVITGFGRTGRWFAVEHDQVCPDLMSVAKGITSGYIPLSAPIARGRLADAFSDTTTQENVHPNTYAAHPVACAAALANLKIMEQDRLVENAAKMGDAAARRAFATRWASTHRGRGARARPAWSAWTSCSPTAPASRSTPSRWPSSTARRGTAGPSSTRAAPCSASPRRSASPPPRSTSWWRWSPTASTPCSATVTQLDGVRSYIPTFPAPRPGELSGNVGM